MTICRTYRMYNICVHTPQKKKKFNNNREHTTTTNNFEKSKYTQSKECNKINTDMPKEAKSNVFIIILCT